eukprot:171963-Pelagomonas_calceolata.AAC.3
MPQYSVGMTASIRHSGTVLKATQALLTCACAGAPVEYRQELICACSPVDAQVLQDNAGKSSSVHAHLCMRRCSRTTQARAEGAGSSTLLIRCRLPRPYRRCTTCRSATACSTWPSR